MSGKIEARMKELGITLPKPSDPGANYVPFVRTGNLMCITGQLPKWENERKFQGKVGAELSIEQGQQAARLCAINIIAVLKASLDGDLDRMVRCVRVRGFVNGAPNFDQFSIVMNGASDLFVEVFGESGRHVRTTIGASLPYNSATEVDADFEVR